MALVTVPVRKASTQGPSSVSNSTWSASQADRSLLPMVTGFP